MGLLSAGAFVRRGFYPLGLLSVGAFIRWGFCPWGFCPRGFCPTLHKIVQTFKKYLAMVLPPDVKSRYTDQGKKFGSFFSN